MAIFAIVEVLRRGGALEVLHGQTVAQDILLQVRAGPKLRKISNDKNKLQMFTRNDDESFKWRELHLVCKITQSKNKTTSVWPVRGLDLVCVRAFASSFCNNVIVMLI